MFPQSSLFDFHPSPPSSLKHIVGALWSADTTLEWMGGTIYLFLTHVQLQRTSGQAGIMRMLTNCCLSSVIYQTRGDQGCSRRCRESLYEQQPLKPFRSICPAALCTCGPTIYFPPPFVPLCQPVLIYLPLNIFARLYCANIPASIHASKAGFLHLQIGKGRLKE